MHSTSTAPPLQPVLGPVGWLGRSVLGVTAYVGGVALLAMAAGGSVLWPQGRNRAAAPGFWKTLMHQLFWMLFTGTPLVGLVHIALGSFLSLQAYYGSTFVDGTGAVVGVGLLRNMGGMMTGLVFSGILSARMIPELRILSRYLTTRASSSSGRRDSVSQRGPDHTDVDASGMTPSIAPARLAAPRIAAASIACLLLSQWGIAVGTVVGWQASQSMMGVPTATFFMMMLKMTWYRDIVGLVVKGFLFGALPATICCYEGLMRGAADDEPVGESISPSYPAHGVAPPCYNAVFRTACLSCMAILVMNSSWFMLVYHAVPFYGPTLLAPPGL